MGLDVSHGCWSGAYSSFGRWRELLADVAGFPPLKSMVGFGGSSPWAAYENDPLTVLLDHSDCDGDIPSGKCAALADRLEELAAKMPEIDENGRHWRECTLRFAAGLRDAAAAGEDLEFY